MFSLKVENVNAKSRVTFVTDEIGKSEKLRDIVVSHFNSSSSVQQPPRPLTRLDIESIMDWTIKREKIQLIKLMREVTGLGLIDAKKIVDNYLEKGQPPF